MITKRHAIILHLFYIDLWEEFKNKIEPILKRGDVDLYVTLVEECSSFKSEIEKLTSFVYVLPNKGLDVGPFLFVFDLIKNQSYSAIFKLHSKKSIHHGHPTEFGENWRRSMVDGIIENEEMFDAISSYISQNPLSMFGSMSYLFDFNRDCGNIPHHYYVIKETINDLNIHIKERSINNSICFSNNGKFFAGTMFATSHEYIKRLLENINISQFYKQLPDGYVLNSKAHAMERIFGYYIEELGGSFYHIKK